MPAERAESSDLLAAAVLLSPFMVSSHGNVSMAAMTSWGTEIIPPVCTYTMMRLSMLACKCQQASLVVAVTL